MGHVLDEVGLKHFHGIKFPDHLVKISVHIISIGVLMVLGKPDGKIPSRHFLKGFYQVLYRNQKMLGHQEDEGSGYQYGGYEQGYGRQQMGGPSVHIQREELEGKRSCD